MCFSIRLFFAIVILLTSTFAQVAAPPLAVVRPVTDEYFGTKVTDNYRWMEDMKSSELKGWIKAQADYTRNVIDAIPGRPGLLAEIQKYDSARTTVDSLQSFGGRCF